MAEIMKPRSQAGEAFFDAALMDCYRGIGYPENWLEEGKTYAPDDAYVISHPSWYMEPMPDVPLISIYELFKRTVDRVPDDVAVIFLDKPVTYRQLDDLISRYAAFLASHGIGKGDVCSAMLPNSLQHIIAFYAAAKIGATHSPLNVMYQADEVEYQLTDNKAKVVLCLDLLADKVMPMVQKGQVRKLLVTNIKDWAADGYDPPEPIKFLWDIPKMPVEGALDFFDTLEAQTPMGDSGYKCDPHNDVALLLYTAGTTGRSKGVIESHFNMVFNSLTHTHAFRAWGDHEINYSIMPMFHTAGYFLHTLPVFYQGGTLIPIPMFDAKDCFRIIEQYKVNVIFAPPTLFIALLADQELVKNSDLSSIAVTIGCGAPVPVALQKQWEELTGARLVNGWGMTETNSGGIISTPDIKEKSEAIGVPVYSETKICDERGNVVKRGVPGEICYRGLQLAKGYLNKPEATAEAFLDDGWFRTGDRGLIDEEDFVHFVDRIKDLIVASGYNVAPVEIEEVLYKHPAVAEVAVIGVPDDYRGETIKAYVALKPGIDETGVCIEDLTKHCKDHLATFKVPRHIELRDTLPKSAVGKILRRVLRDEHMQTT